MKIAITGDLSLKEEIFAKLEELNVLEFKIKQGLQESFEAWSKLKNLQKTEEVTL
jgi:hypothetical protein